MSDFEVHDPRFGGYFMGNAALEKLATGFRWAEGPVWFGDAGCLLFSDIPNNRIMRWSDSGGLSVYRQPSNYTNGHTRDRQGRLLSCEHGGRRVSRTELDGKVTVLADRWQGRPLNSPNDVVVKSDGTVWFTDPHYGIMTDYEGDAAEQEIPCQVYRLDPADGSLTVVADDFACPNGICFSPDETRLYVAETAPMFAADAPRHIRVFDVVDDGRRLRGGEVFYSASPGFADGFRVDSDGNLWTSAGDGVHCLSPQGELLGKIRIPEVVANVTFGGPKKNRLFICGTTSLYAVFLNRRGVQWP
jgi:gluconolactonase